MDSSALFNGYIIINTLIVGFAVIISVVWGAVNVLNDESMKTRLSR